MGCCLSTNDDRSRNPDLRIPYSDGRGGVPPHPRSLPPPPPPPPPEEETVKEVLSETPIPKPSTPVRIDAKNSVVNRNNSKLSEADRLENAEPRGLIKPTDEIFCEASEVSEMYSFAESFSTTTLTEKREDDGEVNQSVERSPPKAPKRRPYSSERERGPRSPARSAPSPERRSHVTPTARSVQSQAITTKRRNGGPANGLRRDPGEGSGRRSRSPVTRGEAAAPRGARQRSQAGSANGQSGGRSPVEKPNDGVLGESNNCESLENPLVSLECFIFL